MSAVRDLARRVAALEERVEVLTREPPAPVAAPTLACVVGAVALQFGMSREVLVGDGQGRREASARQAAMLLARELTQRSTTVIGRALNRHHSTVLHGIEQARITARYEPDFARRLDAARAALSNPRSEA